MAGECGECGECGGRGLCLSALDTAMIGHTIAHYKIIEQLGSSAGESILYSERDSSGSDIMVIENFR